MSALRHKGIEISERHSREWGIRAAGERIAHGQDAFVVAMRMFETLKFLKLVACGQDWFE